MAAEILVALLMFCAAGIAQDSANLQTPAQSPPVQRIRVSAAVLGKLVDQVILPKFPQQALNSGIQGTTTFIVTVDETGKVTVAAPVEGDPLLIAASVDALREFQFHPFMFQGTPIQMESQMGFHFIADREGDKTLGRVQYTSAIPYRPEFRPGAIDREKTLFLWPKKISGQEPHLPPELADKSGSVYLSLTIGENGKVADVTVIGGDDPFISPVVSAVREFAYEPHVINGKPSVIKTEMSYHFGVQQ